MISFHDDQKIKDKYVSRVEAHIKADHLIRGEGWTGNKGCAVGCTLEKYDHQAYETELGVPEWLARVEDTLFEGMGEKKSRTWPKDFLEAIPIGVDLGRVKPKFLIMVLESVLTSFDHEKFPEVKKCVDASIALWKRSDIGSDEWNKAAAWAAWAAAWAARAEAAAEAAAWAAAWAARAAAEAAAWAARAEAAKYDYFADELLKMLRDCK